MPPWTIYQDHLRNLHRGFPLWDPTPKNSLEIIEGSVLYPGIEGTFSVLFNTRKSPDDTHWQPHGVPGGFRTLDEEYGPLAIDGPRKVLGLCGWNCRSVECTREVSGGMNAGFPAGAGPTVSAGAGFKLTCTKTSGALLALSHDPTATYIESSARITSYMARHHESWLEMANSGLGLGLDLEDLYFVSGTMKVPQWFIGVFDRGEDSERGGHLECTVADVFDLSAQVSYTQTVHRSPSFKKGPGAVSTGTDLPWNQCIFMRYFKMKRRLFRTPKAIKAAAGPHVLPGGEPDEESPALRARDHGDDEMELDFEEVPGRDKIWDPVDDLLDYILDRSDADLAIASDSDLYALSHLQGIPQDIGAALSDLSASGVVVIVNEHGTGRIYIPPSSDALGEGRSSTEPTSEQRGEFHSTARTIYRVADKDIHLDLWDMPDGARPSWDSSGANVSDAARTSEDHSLDTVTAEGSAANDSHRHTPMKKLQFKQYEPDKSTEEYNPDHRLKSILEEPQLRELTGGPSTSSSWSPPAGSSMGRSRGEKAELELAPDQPPTTQGQAQTRVYVACTQCRNRKIRCDGAKPVCHNCSRRREHSPVCTYDAVLKRRGPDRAPKERQRSVGGYKQKRRRVSGESSDDVVSSSTVSPGQPTL